MKLVLVLLVGWVGLVCGAWDPASSVYEHSTVMDRQDRFLLSWQTTDDKLIHFKAEVKTQGWFGLGLSPNGNMPGSDIYLFWVNPHTNEAVLSDRHAKIEGVPIKDASSDVFLEAFKKNATHMIFQFHRKLDTCDPDDRAIDGNTMRVIYAYGDVSPTDEDSFDYRFKHKTSDRSNRAIYFNELNTPNTINPNSHDPDEWHLDIRAKNVELDENRVTLYWCLVHKLQDVDEEQHLIRYEPLIEEASLPYVHHFILYSCEKDMSEFAGKEEQCFDESQSHFSAMYECTSKYLAGWAVGGTNHIYPAGVGFPMFTTGSDKYVMLEIHYDNRAQAKNIRDSSGIRLWFTPNLRHVEAATTMFGVPVEPVMQIIPPRQANFTNYAICTSECTSDLPAEGVNVFSGFLHTHLLGRRVKLRQIRNGVELPPLFQDDNYDFNYQEPRMKPKSVKIMPGDEFILECGMSSMRKNNTVFSGFGTPDEMCLVFVEFYPRSSYQLHSCFSTYEVKSALKVLGASNATYKSQVESKGQWKSVQDFVAQDVDWSSDGLVDKWQTVVRDGTHVNFCSASRQTNITPSADASTFADLGLNLKGFLNIPPEKLKAKKPGHKKYEQKTKIQKGLPHIQISYFPSPTCAAAANFAAFTALLATLIPLLF